MNMIFTKFPFSVGPNITLWFLFIRLCVIILLFIWSLQNFDSNVIQDYVFMNDGNGGQIDAGSAGQNPGNAGNGGPGSPGPQPGSPGPQPGSDGPQSSSDGFVPFRSEDEEEKWINDYMYNKLMNHRVSCANTVPYDNRMGNNFTPQEHDYVCGKVLKYAETTNPGTYFKRGVKGVSPERRYTGKITVLFVETIFPKRQNFELE